MWKLALLVIFALCLHVSFAGKGPRRQGNGHHAKKGHKQPGSGHGDHGNGPKGKPDWTKYGGEFDASKMNDDDMMSKMFIMRMKEMLTPMRKFFTEVLALGPVNTIPGQPRFCADNECPKYSVKRKSMHYELRCYEPTKWVTTEMTALKSKVASKTMFWRLFRYIQGANDRAEQIKMTVPVTTLVTPSKTSNAKVYNLSFYIPKSHQASPPSPTDPKVKVITSKPTCYYVHSFGGSAWGVDTFRQHADMLVKALHKDGLNGTYAAPDNMYITAGYDDPMKMFDQHNEVWLMATKTQEDDSI